jgi:hypothetical protein
VTVLDRLAERVEVELTVGCMDVPRRVIALYFARVALSQLAPAIVEGIKAREQANAIASLIVRTSLLHARQLQRELLDADALVVPTRGARS